MRVPSSWMINIIAERLDQGKGRENRAGVGETPQVSGTVGKSKVTLSNLAWNFRMLGSSKRSKGFSEGKLGGEGEKVVSKLQVIKYQNGLDFHTAIQRVKTQWSDGFKILRQHYFQSQLLYLPTLSLGEKGKFSDTPSLENSPVCLRTGQSLWGEKCNWEKNLFGYKYFFF